MHEKYEWAEHMFAGKEEGVLLDRQAPKMLAQIPQRLGLGELFVLQPHIRMLRQGFFAEGEIVWNGASYTIGMQMGEVDAGERLDVSLKLRSEDGEPLLMDLYPPAYVRLADDFYAEKRQDFYDEIYITSAEIRFTCTAYDRQAPVSFASGEAGRPEGIAGNAYFCLGLRFTENCPMWRRFFTVMPEADIPVLFVGTIHAEIGPASYEVTGEYLRAVTLPFWNGSIGVTRCRLTLHSHVEDFYDFSNINQTFPEEKSYMSLTYWRGAADMGSAGLPELWLCEELYQHGQQFTLWAEPEAALSFGTALHVMAALTGQTEMVTLPDWLSINSLKLTSLAFQMQKEEAVKAAWPGFRQELLKGVALCLELTLPAVPIPFFNDEEAPAKASLMLQWDLLHLDPIPAAILAFRSRWKGHGINLNLDLDELSFVGRLYREEERADGGNAPGNIFPGFAGLELSDLRLAGLLPESYYNIQVTFSNPQAQKLPLAGRMLDIDFISGWGFYTPEGVGLGIELRIIFLETMFQISGSYTSDVSGRLLTLEGGLANPFRLLPLIGYILGTPVGSEELNLDIDRLYLRYVAFVGEHDASINESNVKSFRFLIGIVFTWSAVSMKVDTSLSLDWERDRQEKLQMSLSAEVEFMGFSARGFCDVKESDGTLELVQIRFEIRMAGLNLVAQKQEEAGHDALRLDIREINFGIFLESLVNIIIPGVNWYLPWPFRILKQLTLHDIVVHLDNTVGFVRVEYHINLNLAIFHLKQIILEYRDGRGEEDKRFTLTLDISLLSNRQERVQNADEPYVMDLLNGLYPPIPSLGDSLLKLCYLLIGQRIKVDVPQTFDSSGIADVLAQLKKQIRKDGAPILDPENNWVAALKLTLMNSIDVTLLMCDPRIYGIELAVGAGSDMTKSLIGLKLVILYSKVTESIGMFYARLSLPEAFRRIELGAVQIQLGEIAIAIYTNGDFKIDVGFPYGGDFSRSFGLTYLIFSGKGGFYLGVLHGATSTNVPAVAAGHFDTVLELGLGISAGISRELAFGPLKAGASIQMVGIFTGVIAQYVPEESGGQDATYFKVIASAGITAYVYGEVNFVILKISFSVYVSLLVDVVIESYRQTLLALQVHVAVRASIKILFIKINFSFQFDWNPSFVLGENTTAPWERPEIITAVEEAVYQLDWNRVRVFDEPKYIHAVLTPYGSVDGVCLNGESGALPRCRVAILPMLDGYQDETYCRLKYRSMQETPFSALVEATLLRCVKALNVEERITLPALQWLLKELEQDCIFDKGFAMPLLREFLTENLHIRFLPWERKEGEADEHRVPFPMPPVVIALWQNSDGDKKRYDLTKEPPVSAGMFEQMEAYYADLRPDGSGRREGLMQAVEETFSMTEYLFRDYFHLLAKIAVAQAVQRFPAEVEYLTPKELAELVLMPAVLDDISGFVSKSVLGGMRFAYVSSEGFRTESLFSYAYQQYDAWNDRSRYLMGRCIPEEVTEFVYELQKTGTDDWFTFEIPKEAEASEPESIRIRLDKKDFEFPSLDMQAPCTCAVLPYYETVRCTMELKDTTEVLDRPLRRIYGLNGSLPKEYALSVFEDGEARRLMAKIQPCLKLHIPLTRTSGGFFSVGCLSSRTAKLLDELSADKVTGVEVYRIANAPGEPESGFVTLPDNLYLYRQNLSLEAQRPMSANAGGGAHENSAYLLTEQRLFLALLRDAALVGARGYYLACDLPEEAVSDGYVELTLILHYDGSADGLVVDYEELKDLACHPVIVTGEMYDAPVYKSGHTGISVTPKNPEDFFLQPFQMLRSRVETATKRRPSSTSAFRPSRESLPITPLTEGGQMCFSQVLPLYRCFLPEGNPYAGIAGYKSCRLKFALLDVTGNETSEGLMLDVCIGYTDPLESPASYPGTKLCYRIGEKDGDLFFEVILSYKHSETNAAKEEEKSLAKTAYFQLLQEDARLILRGVGAVQSQDKAALLRYLDALRSGEPDDTPVIFTLQTQRPSALLSPLDVRLCIERSEALISAHVTSEGARRAIRYVEATVPPDEAQIKNARIVKKSSTGELYYLSLEIFQLSGFNEYFAIAPLSRHLISLTDLPVCTLSEVEGRASYSDIDMEQWVDQFLKDFEHLLNPESPFARRQEILEELLCIKRELAVRICEDVMSITSGRYSMDAQKAAAEFLADQLRKDLFLGRKVDVVTVCQSTADLNEGQALLMQLDKGIEGFQLSAGKMRKGGRFPIAIRCEDIDRYVNAQGRVLLKATDLEIQEEGMPDFYTYLHPDEKIAEIAAPVPNRYFPLLPGLMRHEYMPSEKLTSWEYRISFSHHTAVQDTVSLQLEWDSVMCANSAWRLPAALGSYMYRRNSILNNEAGAAEAMLKASRAILESWGRNPETEVLGNASHVSFMVDPLKRELRLDGSLKLKVEMQSENGEWTALSDEQGIYRIPDGIQNRPYVYRFTFRELRLQEARQVNTSVWVTRNRQVPDVAPDFIFDTEQARFASALKPHIVWEEQQKQGKWTLDNLTDCISRLCEGFGNITLEVSCGRRLLNAGGLYLWLPMLFKPHIQPEEREVEVRAVYSQTELWLEKNISPQVRADAVIRVYLTMYDAVDDSYNKMEIKQLMFD